MLNKFFNERFFNDPLENVYLVKTSFVNDEGELIKTEEPKALISKKVIQPLVDEKYQDKTIVKQARIYLNKDLDLQDIIIWKNARYSIREDLNRQNVNGYGYRYILDYLNEDI